MLSSFLIPKPKPTFTPPSLLKSIDINAGDAEENHLTHSSQLTKKEKKRLAIIALEKSLFTPSTTLTLGSFQKDKLIQLIQCEIGESQNDYVQRAFFFYLKDKIEHLLKACEAHPNSSNDFTKKIKKICWMLIEETLKVAVPYAKPPHQRPTISRATFIDVTLFKRNSHIQLEEGEDLSPNSFAQYMDKECKIYVKFPMSDNTVKLTTFTPSTFIAESIHNIRDEFYASFKQLIKNVTEIINSYDKNGNKKDLVATFNKDIKQLETNLFNSSKEINFAKLKNILNSLQSEEENYYRSFCCPFSFFSQWNSSLQPKLNEAFELLAKYEQPEEKAISSFKKT